jgi:hypothetical protein
MAFGKDVHFLDIFKQHPVSIQPQCPHSGFLAELDDIFWKIFEGTLLT